MLRADWTIRRLKVDMKTVQVKYRSLLVPAGQHPCRTAPPFLFAFLTFVRMVSACVGVSACELVLPVTALRWQDLA